MDGEVRRPCSARLELRDARVDCDEREQWRKIVNGVIISILMYKVCFNMLFEAATDAKFSLATLLSWQLTNVASALRWSKRFRGESACVLMRAFVF